MKKERKKDDNMPLLSRNPMLLKLEIYKKNSDLKTKKM